MLRYWLYSECMLCWCDPEDEQMPLDGEFQVMDSVGEDGDAPEADQQQEGGRPCRIETSLFSLPLKR